MLVSVFPALGLPLCVSSLEMLAQGKVHVAVLSLGFATY